MSERVRRELSGLEGNVSFYEWWLVPLYIYMQSCPTLSDPMDCSLPGSSFHGIFQAKVLEWGAIAFSVR